MVKPGGCDTKFHVDRRRHDGRCTGDRVCPSRLFGDLSLFIVLVEHVFGTLCEEQKFEIVRRGVTCREFDLELLETDVADGVLPDIHVDKPQKEKEQDRGADAGEVVAQALMK